MPRLVDVRKKQRVIILSSAAKKELCARFGVYYTTLGRALSFKRDSLKAHEIRSCALNEYNGILIER